MLDLPVPTPKDPRNGQRTGFSFGRSCIPKLAGYKGQATYVDADMLVFQDIEGLWNLPFNGAKILTQEEVKFADVTMTKDMSPLPESAAMYPTKMSAIKNGFVIKTIRDYERSTSRVPGQDFLCSAT